MDLSLLMTILFFIIVAAFFLGVIHGFRIHASYTVKERKNTNRDFRIQEDNSLRSRSDEYIHWNVGQDTIVLDGNFNIEDLEFIAWHMKTAKPVTNTDSQE